MFDYIHDRHVNLSYNAEQFMLKLKEITQFQFFSSCVFGEWRQRYSLPFSLILTKHGLCFNFNLIPAESLLHLDKVAKDFQYTQNFLVSSNDHALAKSKQPLPWMGYFSENDLFTIQLYGSRNFKNKIVVYDISNPFQPLRGWRIIIHSTDQLPSSSDFQFILETWTLVRLKIKPIVLMIDDDLKQWGQEKRGCFLPNEKLLKFFKKYSKRNCELECLSFEILKSCDCVPFYVIRKFELKPQNFWNLLIFMIFRRS